MLARAHTVAPIPPPQTALAEEASQDLATSFGQRAADLMDSCLEGGCRPPPTLPLILYRAICVAVRHASS